MASVTCSRRSLRLLLPATAGTGLAALLLSAGNPAAAAPACKPGTHRFGSVQARTFCGPASGTAKIGGRTLRFKGGSCRSTKDSVSVNIGTVVLGTTNKARPDYLGVTVGRTPAGGTPAPVDGTYTTGSVVAVVKKNKGYAVVQPSVTLTNHRTRGTFTAKLLGSGDTVTGSFRCR